MKKVVCLDLKFFNYFYRLMALYLLLGHMMDLPGYGQQMVSLSKY